MSDKPEMVRLAPPDTLDMPIGEAMFTQRAIRRLDPGRPISDEQLRTILDAGSKAPNGANLQPGRFLVVRDRERIRKFGALYHEAWWAKRRDEYGWSSKADIPEGSPYRMPALLADEMVDAPAVILAFSLPSGVAASSTFPAVQNILLAARALGIGSVLTTLHPDVMDRVYAMFGVPPEMVFHCCIPLGHPRGRFGPTARYPTSHTTSWDDWGSRPPWE
ncbi:MAG: nitroreductase family protein [Immundisolibacterales bacterium]|nr:nitroreductase family protein [Immundisolibacterales bacterium]